MARKPDPPQVERHGALEFCHRERKKGSSNNHMCRYKGHPPSGAWNAPWRVFIAGYPFLDDFGEQLYVCGRCKVALTAIWTGALRLGEEAA